MKTYLISGRKLEHDVQCGCSHGDSALCLQPSTLEVVQPSLAHQPLDKKLVSVSEDELRRCFSPHHSNVKENSSWAFGQTVIKEQNVG